MNHSPIWLDRETTNLDPLAPPYTCNGIAAWTTAARRSTWCGVSLVLWCHVMCDIYDGARQYLTGFCLGCGTWFAFYMLAAMR